MDGVLLGYGIPCTGPFPPESWAYNSEIKDLEYDPEKARMLFAQAGWNMGKGGFLEKDGKPFSFTVLVNQGNEARLKTAQIIKENLKRVGVDMNIKVLEWQTMLHEFIDKKRFEAVIMGWALSRDPDAYDIWHSSKTREGEFNFISYKNEEIDRLLLSGRRTFDIEKRKKFTTGFTKSFLMSSHIHSCMFQMPFLCFIKDLKVLKRHHSVYGMTLYTGMFQRIRLSGTGRSLCYNIFDEFDE
ncbi:MAG: ABC transporter substrate-binding protein [Nitrospirota bacterium]